jgi:hypothetical protein
VHQGLLHASAASPFWTHCGSCRLAEHQHPTLNWAPSLPQDELHFTAMWTDFDANTSDPACVDAFFFFATRVEFELVVVYGHKINKQNFLLLMLYNIDNYFWWYISIHWFLKGYGSNFTFTKLKMSINTVRATIISILLLTTAVVSLAPHLLCGP